MIKKQLELTQNQRLVLSPQMKQSFHILKLPLQELVPFVAEQIAQNPILELEEPEQELMETSIYHERRQKNKVSLHEVIENTLAEQVPLHIHLTQQAKELFNKEQFLIAEHIIGELNEKGFLDTELEEIVLFVSRSKEEVEKVLEKMHSFDPPGIAARNLRESLLIQLKRKSLENSLAYKIILSYYDAFLRNQIPLIAKKLKKKEEEILATIDRDILSLNLSPAKWFPLTRYQEESEVIIPDIIIDMDQDEITIEVNEKFLPKIRMNREYLKILNDPEQEQGSKKYIKDRVHEGKIFVKNLEDRKKTLYRITEEIVKLQKNFFVNPGAPLSPLTMKQVADKLHLHESTIARAANSKYLDTPRGILSMRSFFTNSFTNIEGELISSSAVRDILMEIIAAENPKDPFADEKIADLIKQRGITCARRTVAKYRNELHIGNRAQRKKY